MSERTAIINGLIVDPATGNIRIGVGATGHFRIELDGVESGAINTDTDIVIFSAEETVGEERVVIHSFHGHSIEDKYEAKKKIFHKVFPISVDEDGTYFTDISLTNTDTRAMGTGTYLWNATIVTDPEYDEDGKPIVDDMDCVVPIYLNGDRPEMLIEEVGYIV